MPSGKRGKEQSEAKKTAVHCVMSANHSNIISFSYDASDLFFSVTAPRCSLNWNMSSPLVQVVQARVQEKKTGFVSIKAASVTWNSNNVLHHVQHISTHPTSPEHSIRVQPDPDEDMHSRPCRVPLFLLFQEENWPWLAPCLF